MSIDNRKKKDNRKRTEIVWRHISENPVRSELQKLYDAGKFDCFTGGVTGELEFALRR